VLFDTTALDLSSFTNVEDCKAGDLGEKVSGEQYLQWQQRFGRGDRSHPTRRR